jgi:hypothetical protein
MAGKDVFDSKQGWVFFSLSGLANVELYLYAFITWLGHWGTFTFTGCSRIQAGSLVLRNK